MKFKSDIEVQARLKDSSGNAGTSGQVLSTAGTSVSWVDASTLPAQSSQNLITEVWNETGSTLVKGTVVYINNGHGNLPTITKALATSDATSAQTYGVVRVDITNNNNGWVVVIGSLSDLDTQAYTPGTILYLSSTTAGTWTSTKQYAPAHLVYVGIVVRSHPTQGVVEIKIQNGYELDELHNVSAQTPANNNGIFYNTATSLWEAKSIASALGYTPANNALIISTTAPLQGGGDLSTNRTLSITQATTSTNGYLSSTDWNTFNSKQVAISFNSPLSYSLGTLSINQATTSSNGYLSSTDWNTFNGKQNALTNPITGTGTTNYIPKFTGTRAISNSLIYDNGTNVGIGTTSPTAKFQVDGGYVSITSGAVSSVGWQSNGLNFTTAASIYNGIYSPSDSVISAATSGSERMRITSGGNVGIGTTSPNYKLSVLSPNNVTWIEDTSGASGAVFALFSAPGNTGIGSIARVGTTSAIAYNSTSDYRLKEDLKEVNGLDKISKIKIYDFKWKNHTDRMDGVVAHELQEVVPYAVTGEKDGEQMQSVDYSKLVPILVQATQELKAEIEILKTK